MKPTEQQKQGLQEYLHENLRYRETYTEFYDHILTALETKPETMSFQDAVESIIAEDFGGYEGMGKIESRYKNSISKEIKRKYFTYALEYLKFPLIGLTALLAIGFYWVTRQSWCSFSVFFYVILGMRMLPGIVRRIGYMRSGYIFKSPKRSVKDSVFQWLDYIPAILFILVLVPHGFDNRSPLILLTHANSVGLIIFWLAYAIHFLTYYKVYKDEFKTRITA